MAWAPDGYYTSSVYGDNYVGWHLNRGKDQAPDFYRAVQFDRILYRPDRVADAFRQAQIINAATFNATPFLVAATLFVLITIPLARFTDWLAARDRRRQQAGRLV